MVQCLCFFGWGEAAAFPRFMCAEENKATINSSIAMASCLHPPFLSSKRLHTQPRDVSSKESDPPSHSVMFCSDCRNTQAAIRESAGSQPSRRGWSEAADEGAKSSANCNQLSWLSTTSWTVIRMIYQIYIITGGAKLPPPSTKALPKGTRTETWTGQGVEVKTVEYTGGWEGGDGQSGTTGLS